MAENTTPRKDYPFPSSTGLVKNGALNFEELAERADELDDGHQDFLQPGVVKQSDWSFTATISALTGALGSSGPISGKAWLPDPVISGALMRSVTSSPGLSGLLPPSLPASGKYMAVGFELAATKWGSAATVTVKSGAEKPSSSEAEEATPAVTVGRARVRDVIIKNTAGAYSIVKQIDRRPWARGANTWLTLESNFTVASSGGFETLPLTQRIECSGAPGVGIFAGLYRMNPSTGAEQSQILVKMPFVVPFQIFTLRPRTSGIESEREWQGFNYRFVGTPVAGSQLMKVQAATSEMKPIEFAEGSSLQFSEVPSLANNGLS